MSVSEMKGDVNSIIGGTLCQRLGDAMFVTATQGWSNSRTTTTWPGEKLCSVETDVECFVRVIREVVEVIGAAAETYQDGRKRLKAMEGV